MRRIIAAILLVAVLAIGGGIIANTAYQAGLQHRRHDHHRERGTVVAPVVVPAYGYGIGWHPFGFGFGMFGLFGTLFFLFIVFGAHPGHLLARRPRPSRRLGSGCGWGDPAVRATSRPTTARRGNPEPTTPSTTGTAGRTTAPAGAWTPPDRLAGRARS